MFESFSSLNIRDNHNSHATCHMTSVRDMWHKADKTHNFISGDEQILPEQLPACQTQVMMMGGDQIAREGRKQFDGLPILVGLLIKLLSSKDFL